jgi:hypothetical protein
MLFYGLALVAMQHFAPRSIVVLGWSFLLAFGVARLTEQFDTQISFGEDDAMLASILMALTFGLFHIAYAVVVWTGLEARRVAGGKPR